MNLHHNTIHRSLLLDRSTYSTTLPALGVVFLFGLFLGLLLLAFGQFPLLPGEEGDVGDLGEVGAQCRPLLLHQFLDRDLVLLLGLLQVLQTQTGNGVGKEGQRQWPRNTVFV